MTCLLRVKPTGGANAPEVNRGAARLRAGLIAGALLLAWPQGHAHAADWLDDTLRGTFNPGPAVRWDGVHLGGSIGVMNMRSDLSRGLGPLTSRMLTNSTVLVEAHPDEWNVLQNQTTNGRSYGGFVGYNFQWDSLVLGIDGGYNKTSMPATSSSGSLNRVVATSDSTAHNITITGTASTKLIDYATLRLRTGYAFGQFMPYAILGGAVGRFDYSSTASLTDSQTQGGGAPSVYTAGPISESKNNAIIGGFVAGLGMDIALTPNVFLRGEYEFVGFAKVNGVNNSLSTGRVGLGVRF
jgi:outer membrane immunogenic protein